MKYLVVDIEATCWEHNDPDKQFHETIEIGAVLLDENFDIVKSQSFYCRPTFNTQLTTYCTQLTGIGQANVDNALPFDKALLEFIQWVGDFSDITLCSWGEFDKKQLIEDCTRNSCAYPFTQAHINIKQVYLDTLKRHTKGGLQKACRVCGIHFEGTPHNGRDDAIMAAKIFKMMKAVKD